MGGLASDTPLGARPGSHSVYQGVHWDGPGLADDPPEAYINWPLCDIDHSNGPF